MVALTVVVPTYCEAENLDHLVPEVDRVLRAADISYEIIVVDDNSPDETIPVCSRLAETYPLKLIARMNERGLSSAVVAGMQQARGDVLMCMDADLSHPPDAIPFLYAAVSAGSVDVRNSDQQLDAETNTDPAECVPSADERCDFVVGSRYVDGGGTDDDWGVFRWFNSVVATVLARPLTSVRDPMAGFFALRRSTFEQANQLDPVGWKIGLELIVKCRCRHVREVPIHFRNRHYGESKLSLREQWNYLRHLRRLYAFRFPVLSRFAYAGMVAVGITGVFLLVNRLS